MFVNNRKRETRKKTKERCNKHNIVIISSYFNMHNTKYTYGEIARLFNSYYAKKNKNKKKKTPNNNKNNNKKRRWNPWVPNFTPHPSYSPSHSFILEILLLLLLILLLLLLGNIATSFFLLCYIAIVCIGWLPEYI